MAKELSSTQVKKNIVYSVGAQCVSLFVSILLNLLVPKFISEIDYANWQTYLLYVGYVGIFHFGLLDGMMLRFSQYDYEELEKRKIQAHFFILLLILSVTALLIGSIGYFREDPVSKTLFIMVSLAVISRNIYTYTSYSFQMTNRINRYALLVIIHRVVYALGIIVLLIFRLSDFVLFCVVDILADLFAICFGIINNKELYFCKISKIIVLLSDVWKSVTAGIILLIANWSSMFLIGGAKMIIQWHWPKLIFGKISFAFSISNLFLVFVTAISVVLFPSLKRIHEEKLPKMYQDIRNAISPLLFIIIIFYFPGSILLERWLPRYSQSIMYLGVLLPIIIFSSKVSLLTNNYLKAYREEKKLLYINLITVVIAFIFYIIAAYLFNTVDLILFSVVFVIMLRSIISEIVVSKLIGIHLVSDFFVESVLTLCFIISTRFFSILLGFIIYMFILSIYLFFKRKQISYTFTKLIKRKSKNNKQ